MPSELLQARCYVTHNIGAKSGYLLNPLSQDTILYITLPLHLTQFHFKLFDLFIQLRLPSILLLHFLVARFLI